MSFLNKMIFKTFLFFALICFCFSLHAQTYTYYKSWVNQGYCAATASAICQDAANKFNQVLKQCDTSFSSYYNATFVKAMTRTYVCSSYDPATSSCISGSNSGDLIAIHPDASGISQTITCEEGEKLELNGCTATCVPDNQCTEKAGQTETRISQCGLLQGTNCTSKATPDAGDTFTKTCDSYAFSWTPINAKYNLGSCEGVVIDQKPLIKDNGNLEPSSIYDGSSNTIPLNCELTIQYTGKKYETPTDGTQPPTSSPKSTSNGGSATTPTDNGSEGTPLNGTSGLKQSSNGTSDGVGTGTGTGTGDGGGGATTGGGSGGGGGDTGTCDPTKSICEGSGDGSASTGDITKPAKIQNTVTKSWWESSYKDGLQGVWNKHKSTFDNTPFIQSLNSITNGAPNSGSCPSFQFHFLQYNGNIEPPCFIWPVLKAFFLFSTLMLCRRIIFGG